MIIWIASYPKSGNTWVRLFLTTYFLLSKRDITIPQFAKPEDLMDLNIDFKNFGEIIKNWIPLQQKINLNSKINFLKTHNALCKINNFKFTDKDNTLGAIYLVRDPRDIILSYANHLGQTHDQILEGMLLSSNCESFFFQKKKFKKTLLGSWSDNINSWKSFKERKFVFIRYEDLINDPLKYFRKILNYLINDCGVEIEFNEKILQESIDKNSFEKLRKNESLNGFKEASKHGVFFRKGIAGDWKKNLDKKIIKQIEGKFYKEMKEFGYL